MQVLTKSTWRVFPPILAREECSICQGTGWELVHSSSPPAARRCPCVALNRTARLKDKMRIPEQYRHCRLEGYHPKTLAQTRALAEAWKFVECFPNVDRGMIFVGGSGSGKTHLAVGILLDLAERFQEDSLFADFRSLPGPPSSGGLIAAHGNPSGSRLRNVLLLVLDDFGAGSSTDIQYQAALQVLHSRMRARKPTLCTGPGPVGANSDRRLFTKGACGSRSVIHQADAFLLGGFKIVPLGDEEARRKANFFSGFL